MNFCVDFLKNVEYNKITKFNNVEQKILERRNNEIQL
nr:MAG TPA: hypothetical protein [Caudoviricetes sp.]